MCCTFLILAKAFDTVNHSVFQKKLSCYDIRGIALQLIESFLDNRKQYTVVKNVCSLSQNVTCGVPQGSTLGPLLFIIYINDLVQTTNFKVNLFVDDTLLIMLHKSIKKMQKQVNYKINQVGKWMNANKLTINYSKSNFMLFTNKKKNSKFKLEINNNQITESDIVKYLGVIIDNKLNWKTHIEHICSKIVKGSWALTRLKKYVSKQTLIKIYYSMIYSHCDHDILLITIFH